MSATSGPDITRASTRRHEPPECWKRRRHSRCRATVEDTARSRGGALTIGAGAFALFPGLAPTTLNDELPWMVTLAIHGVSLVSLVAGLMLLMRDFRLPFWGHTGREDGRHRCCCGAIDGVPAHPSWLSSCCGRVAVGPPPPSCCWHVGRWVRCSSAERDHGCSSRHGGRTEPVWTGDGVVPGLCLVDRSGRGWRLSAVSSSGGTQRHGTEPTTLMVTSIRSERSHYLGRRVQVLAASQNVG